VSLVVLDTGPLLNFLSIGQGNLMHQVLGPRFERVLMPREVVNEIEDKSLEDSRFARANPVLGGMLRQGLFEVLESDADSDMALVTALKFVSRLPPSALLVRRAKDLGETLVVAHAIKLRDEGNTVILVIDDRGGQALAAKHKFRIMTTPRILATAASEGLVNRADMKKIYERLRPSNGSKPMDDGLPHWQNSGLDDKKLYRAGP
jgi:predicted nucleic acid-binding protein